MAVVKADGYGHGAVAVSRAMNEIGIMQFGVATLGEGILLREAGILGEILIFGPTAMRDLDTVRAHDLTQTIIDFPYGKELIRVCSPAADHRPLKVQIKVDTGMHRYGVSPSDLEAMLAWWRSPHILVTGIYSHLGVCDLPTPEGLLATQQQQQRFSQFVERLRSALACQGKQLPPAHLKSSYGLLNDPDNCYDLVRVGIALYGAVDATMMVHPEQASLFLPVLSVKARVVSLRDVPAGEPAGYGLEASANHDRRLALLSIGYADGIPRSLGESGAWVMIRGAKARIVGRICMDCLLVDVTTVEGVTAFDVAVLLDGSGSGGMDVAQMAWYAGTIPNEIISRLGSRLTKFFLP